MVSSWVFFQKESRTGAKPTSKSKTGRNSRGIGTNPEDTKLCWSVIYLTSQYGNYCSLTLHGYTRLPACQFSQKQGAGI